MGQIGNQVFKRTFKNSCQNNNRTRSAWVVGPYNEMIQTLVGRVRGKRSGKKKRCWSRQSWKEEMHTAAKIV